MIFLFTDQRKKKEQDAGPVPDETQTKRKEQGTSNEMSLQKQ